jgi:hypothetical protein
MATAGHKLLTNVETNMGFVACCECGWRNEETLPQTHAGATEVWAVHVRSLGA